MKNVPGSFEFHEKGRRPCVLGQFWGCAGSQLGRALEPRGAAPVPSAWQSRTTHTCSQPYRITQQLLSPVFSRFLWPGEKREKLWVPNQNSGRTRGTEVRHQGQWVFPFDIHIFKIRRLINSILTLAFFQSGYLTSSGHKLWKLPFPGPVW